MMRYPLYLVVWLALAPCSLPAQRGGRPDRLQNFERIANPQLLLEVSIRGKRSYFRPSDLRKCDGRS